MVPGGNPIDIANREVFGFYMRTDGVVAHMNSWVLKSVEGDSNEVRKIGPKYGKDLYSHRLEDLIKQGHPNIPILSDMKHDESKEEHKTWRNVNKKKKHHYKKLVEKVDNAQGEIICQWLVLVNCYDIFSIRISCKPHGRDYQ